MTCAYCNAPCQSQWSPADDKSQRFAACNWLHAIYALNVPLIVAAWRQHV